MSSNYEVDKFWWHLTKDEALELLGRLTPQERIITDKIVAGLTAKEVAMTTPCRAPAGWERMGTNVTPRTVETHKTNIGRKLEMTPNSTAIAYLYVLAGVHPALRNKEQCDGS